MDFQKKKPNRTIKGYFILVIIGLVLIGISIKFPFVGVLIIFYIFYSWFTGFKKMTVDDNELNIHYRFVDKNIKWEDIKKLEAKFNTAGGGTYYVFHGKSKDWFVKEIDDYETAVRMIEDKTGKKFIRVA